MSGMHTLETLRARREEILEIARRHKTSNVRVFGSIARGTADEESDVDLLFTTEPGCSLFNLGGLWHDLNEALGGKVDVATENGLKLRIRDRVLKQAVPL